MPTSKQRERCDKPAVEKIQSKPLIMYHGKVNIIFRKYYGLTFTHLERFAADNGFTIVDKYISYWKEYKCHMPCVELIWINHINSVRYGVSFFEKVVPSSSKLIPMVIWWGFGLNGKIVGVNAFRSLIRIRADLQETSLRDGYRLRFLWARRRGKK
jgi:hypothetical protein